MKSAVRMFVSIVSAVVMLSVAASSGQTADEARVKMFTDMSSKELLKAHRTELSGIKLNPSQDVLDSLLRKAGENVTSFFRDFSNMSVKERVFMRRYSGQAALLNMQYAYPRTKEFNYMIMPNADKTAFSEFRTDMADRPIDPRAEAGTCILSYGYAGLSLYLHPRHQPNSNFRYLGQERRKPFAHVIAFSQKPEARDFMSQSPDRGASKPVGFLVQGFVWFDPESGQIMRLRTFMLRAEKETDLIDQITDVVYEPVHIDDNRPQFWLPREVDVSWAYPGASYRNQHRYSGYRLFSVSSDYKVSLPEEK